MYLSTVRSVLALRRKENSSRSNDNLAFTFLVQLLIFLFFVAHRINIVTSF